MNSRTVHLGLCVAWFDVHTFMNTHLYWFRFAGFTEAKMTDGDFFTIDLFKLLSSAYSQLLECAVQRNYRFGRLPRGSSSSEKHPRIVPRVRRSRVDWQCQSINLVVSLRTGEETWHPVVLKDPMGVILQLFAWLPTERKVS